MKAHRISKDLIVLKTEAWKQFCLAVNNSLGKPAYVSIIEYFIEGLQKPRCKDVTTNAFSLLAFGLFPPNMGEVSDEHGEQFYQKIKKMKKQCQVSITKNMMAVFCGFLQRENGPQHERQAKRMKHFYRYLAKVV